MITVVPVVRARTELLLYELLWSAETLVNPTVGNLFESFESWAYRSGLLRTIQRLEAQEIIETEGKSLDRVVKLTEKGRKLVEGDRDPEAKWEQEWDGFWRMVIFDVPEEKRKLREELRGRLKSLGFGCLQKSVWISPHPMPRLAKFLKGAIGAPASLTLMEGRELTGVSGKQTAAVAWDFDRINRGYARYLEYLEQWQAAAGEHSLEEGLANEKKRWREAVDRDPLLPRSLLPGGYLGERAWRERRKIIPGLIMANAKRAIIE